MGLENWSRTSAGVTQRMATPQEMARMGFSQSQIQGALGGGGGGGNMAGIGQHLQGLQDQANQANEARFAKLMELAQQFGATQMRRNDQLTQQQLAGTQSGLLSRGLGNSTVTDTMRAGVLRQGEDRAADISQRVAELQMGPIERRTDQGPDLGMYASLLSQPGAGGLVDGLFGIPAGRNKKQRKRDARSAG